MSFRRARTSTTSLIASFAGFQLAALLPAEKLDTPHWAFVAPTSSALPEVAKKDWPRNELDYFVLARLEEEGLQPTAEANRETLIRRLTLDLTGLPPTMAEVEAFLTDKSPDAYEKVVDRLLASAHYGERMAVMWLDLARYGDSSVYHTDGNREMWAWRDGVIEAYNANKPFDQFSIDQLAGDLIPDASLAQQVASGFNRNNGTTDEGGTIEEEFRIEYAVDRVKTTATTWLGLTMECAQCHDHKYDPISQKEYYQFFAFFNRSTDKGKQQGGRNAPPLVEIPNEESQRKLPGVTAKRSELKARIDGYPHEIEAEMKKWIAALGEKITNSDEKFDPRDAVVHLPFDESKGTIAADRAQSDRSANIVGDPRWTPGRVFGGFEFVEDEKSHVALPGEVTFERDQPFTLSLWLRPKKTKEGKDSQGSLLTNVTDETTQRGLDLFYQTNQRLYLRLSHNAEDNAILVHTDQEIHWDKWQHVCVTYDGSSSAGGVRVYVDGKPFGVKGDQDNLKESIKVDGPLRVGKRPGGSRLIGAVDELRIFSRVLTEEEALALVLRDTVVPVLALPEGAEWVEEQRKTFLDYYLWRIDKTYAELVKKEGELKHEEEELRRPLTTVMVMRDQDRKTYVLRRGLYSDRTDTLVEPGVPVRFPPLPKDAPPNRLGLAHWLFQDDNPLTARVAVNRYWQMLFGIGLVSTPEDFGSQGDAPSHPELLDWLAADFRDHGWNVKRTIRKLVTSATYRQSATAPRSLYERDPKNRLLARGSRYRLQAEFLRDNALALSGLLVDKMGGPGVKPYQPEGLWKEVLQGGDRLFVQDKGEKLYRRSVYTFWRRTCAPPNMLLFDAPTREKCIAQRSRTNTPLQALVTLNDVQYVEAARNLAQRMIKEGGASAADRIAWGFRLATSRPLRTREHATLFGIYQHSHQKYAANQEAAVKLISTGESPRDEGLHPADHAALTIVASMLLNLDETLTRE